MFNFWMLGGLLFLVLFVAGVSAVLSWQQRRYQKEQLEQWEREKRQRCQERMDQERMEMQQRKSQLKQADWLVQAADELCQRESPASRIEIWNDQLIVEEGTGNDICFLEKFGLHQKLDKKEVYAANQVLYEMLRDRQKHPYYLEDNGLYCEIIGPR